MYGLEDIEKSLYQELNTERKDGILANQYYEIERMISSAAFWREPVKGKDSYT